MLCISWRKEAPSVLERGRAVYVGKTDDGLHKNSYVAFFLGHQTDADTRV